MFRIDLAYRYFRQVTALAYLAMLSCHVAMATFPPGEAVGWGAITLPHVESSTTFRKIAAGSLFSVAIKADATVVGWGWNSFGETTIPRTLSNVFEVAAGWNHSMALKSNGLVAVWGDPGATNIPAGLTNVNRIAAGGKPFAGYCLALKSNGTVVAWGNSDSGQTNVPSGLSNVVGIAAGASHSLALKSDGTIIGWGKNSSSQATAPANLTNVTAVAAGTDFSLALKIDGTVVAWGD